MYIHFDVGTQWSCMVNPQSGYIIARENTHCVHPRTKELNVSNPINQFPYTDEDFIITKARTVLLERR